MKILEGKIAIITGASRGIGKGIAEKFISQGATVVFTYASSDEKARALEAELAAMGGVAKGYKSDAADFNAAQALIDQVVADFGTVDILVNNAGVGYLMAPFTEMPLERWDLVLGVNLTGAFLCSKHAAQLERCAACGSI
mgnify:CR=1 FL=1